MTVKTYEGFRTGPGSRRGRRWSLFFVCFFLTFVHSWLGFCFCVCLSVVYFWGKTTKQQHKSISRLESSAPAQHRPCITENNPLILGFPPYADGLPCWVCIPSAVFPQLYSEAGIAAPAGRITLESWVRQQHRCLQGWLHAACSTSIMWQD